MSKNPFVNACLAGAYIALVACVMTYAPHTDDGANILAPISALSLFVLSAAVMGYLFFLQPVLMYLEGQKKDAVTLFVRTLMAFAVVTVMFLSLFFMTTT